MTRSQFQEFLADETLSDSFRGLKKGFPEPLYSKANAILEMGDANTQLSIAVELAIALKIWSGPRIKLEPSLGRRFKHLAAMASKRTFFTQRLLKELFLDAFGDVAWSVSLVGENGVSKRDLSLLDRILKGVSWDAFTCQTSFGYHQVFELRREGIRGVADLVLDGHLIDIKTSIAPKVQANDLRQLLGYVLLNELADEPVPISRLSSYFPRFDAWSGCAIDDLDLNPLRRNFARAVLDSQTHEVVPRNYANPLAQDRHLLRLRRQSMLQNWLTL